MHKKKPKFLVCIQVFKQDINFLSATTTNDELVSQYLTDDYKRVLIEYFKTGFESYEITQFIKYMLENANNGESKNKEENLIYFKAKEFTGNLIIYGYSHYPPFSKRWIKLIKQYCQKTSEFIGLTEANELNQN